jgi:HEAT repeat protein/beta-lactamase regulating signal transducer with metallopeptidase domain
MPIQTQGLAAWLLTYALHSTLLLGAAWFVLRHRRVPPAAADVLWKVAMVGGVVTATAQASLAHWPVGSFSLAVATAPAVEASLHADDGADRTGERAQALETPAQSTMPATTGRDESPAPASGGLPSLPTLLSVGWLAVAALLVGGYAARRLVLVGRLGDRRLVGDPRVTGLLDTLRLETGVTTPIRLTTSRAISSPVALRGEICVPEAALAELEPEQQRAMLAHELAHLVRKDPQWLAAACMLERAFFFQPLNRLARRGVQTSAEYLADEWAARRAGGVPLARALVKVAEWIQASPLGVPVAGFAEERSQLTVRVTRLLDARAWATQGSRWGVGMLAAGAIAVTTAFAPGVSRSPAGGPVPSPAAGERGRAAQPDDAQPAPQRADTSLVAAVIERLRDEDDEVRRVAAEALGRLKHPSAIAPLVRALEDEDPDVRHAALDALGNFERGVPPAPIRRLLASTDANVRANAARMLGDMKDRGSIPAITALLADADEDVRHDALHALEEMDAPVEDATIGRVLEDPSPEVRQTAAHFAGERRMVSLVPALIKMMDDTNGEVRETAAEALTEMRTEASHRALRLAITHRDARVRRVAVEYLGEEDDR